MRKLVLGAMLGLTVTAAAPLSAFAAPSAAPLVAYQPLPKPGKPVPLDSDHYFIYGFEKPPKLGTAIMRVEIFTRDGKRDTSFTVMGDADMPSMRGGHSSGEKAFSISAKGIYLLPVRLVMPGDWEIRFTFGKHGNTVLRSAYVFDL